jgi:bifunctional oligoribonuclease and PAP phosphatase NrnA
VQEKIRSIAAALEQGHRFVVVTHVNPDGDAVGCLLGMHLALREMGKQSWPLSRDGIPHSYDFLPGTKDVVSDPSEIPAAPDWIVSLDVATEPRISGDIADFRRNARLINIDHHPTNPGFGDLNWIETTASSTAELVFRVLKETRYTPSAAVGKCLYTGLVTDTGGFRFAGVTGNTLRIGAELLDSGFTSYDVTGPLFEEYPLHRLKLERLALERLEIILDGKLALSTLYAEDFPAVGAEHSDAENLVDKLRDIRGVAAGVLITKMSDTLVRASLRSKNELDVSAIAGAFGGGGHRRAAGLRSDLPLPLLKEKLILLIAQALRSK